MSKYCFFCNSELNKENKNEMDIDEDFYKCNKCTLLNKEKELQKFVDKRVTLILKKRKEQDEKAFICPNCREECDIDSETYMPLAQTLPISSCCNFLISSQGIEIIDKFFKLKKKNTEDPCLYCNKKRTIVKQQEPFNDLLICFSCYKIDKQKSKYFKSVSVE